MSLRIGAVGLLAACASAHAPLARHREPRDRAYYAVVGLPQQSLAVSLGDAPELGRTWIAIDQAPYALVPAADGRVDLLSPLVGPTIPKIEGWDEPIGTVRKPMLPDAAFTLSLVDRTPSTAATVMISVDESQPCDPYGDAIAKQIDVRQRGCFLEPSHDCDGVRSLAAAPDGTYVIGPLRASVMVVCTPVAYEL